MIKSFISYLKKKQIIYYGLLTTNSLDNDELRIIAKLLFSSGLSLDEIKLLKWKDITILENIFLISNKEQTRIAIASDYFVKDLLKLNHKDYNVFSSNMNIKNNLIINKIDYILKLKSIELSLDNLVNCEWLQDNFKNTIYIPQFSKKYFKEHILNKKLIHKDEINKKEFNKILDIKSLL